MFSQPKFGWTTVQYQDIQLGHASNIVSVIVPTLQALIDYLSHPDTEFSALHLVFDGEGYEFGIVQIGFDFYYWHTKTDGPNPILTCLTDKKYITELEFVATLSEEIIKDVKAYLDDWAYFECETLECPDEQTLKETKNQILDLVHQLEYLLQ